MIRTLATEPECEALKPHFKYQFIHHYMLFCAYDELGRTLDTLRKVIEKKYAAMLEDTTRYVYYVALIHNLEKQFSNTIIEGLNGGSVKIIKTAAVTVEEREVA